MLKSQLLWNGTLMSGATGLSELLGQFRLLIYVFRGQKRRCHQHCCNTRKISGMPSISLPEERFGCGNHHHSIFVGW
jgi:hypothetical protein